MDDLSQCQQQLEENDEILDSALAAEAECAAERKGCETRSMKAERDLRAKLKECGDNATDVRQQQERRLSNAKSSLEKAIEQTTRDNAKIRSLEQAITKLETKNRILLAQVEELKKELRDVYALDVVSDSDE